MITEQNTIELHIACQSLLTPSLFCQLYNYYVVPWENLVLDQLKIPELIVFFILVCLIL